MSGRGSLSNHTGVMAKSFRIEGDLNRWVGSQMPWLRFAPLKISVPSFVFCRLNSFLAPAHIFFARERKLPNWDGGGSGASVVCLRLLSSLLHSFGRFETLVLQTCTTGTSGTALICYISSFYGLAMCVLPFKLFDRLKTFQKAGICRAIPRLR